MDVDEILLTAEEKMGNAVEALGNAFGSVRTGRANARVLDRIKVDYYGAATPINQLAGIKTPDARLLVIEPWDKSSLKAIEKAIMESDLGVTPSNDGMCIRLPFPALTEERRRELVKQCKGYAEDAGKAEKAGDITEDDQRDGENDVQKLTDKYIKKIDEMFKKKEAEVMEI